MLTVLKGTQCWWLPSKKKYEMRGPWRQFEETRCTIGRPLCQYVSWRATIPVCPLPKCLTAPLVIAYKNFFWCSTAVNKCSEASRHCVTSTRQIIRRIQNDKLKIRHGTTRWYKPSVRKFDRRRLAPQILNVSHLFPKPAHICWSPPKSYSHKKYANIPHTPVPKSPRQTDSKMVVNRQSLAIIRGKTYCFFLLFDLTSVCSRFVGVTMVSQKNHFTYFIR